MEKNTNFSTQFSDNFRNNKKAWVLAIVVIVLALLVLCLSRIQAVNQKPLACQPNDIYNIDTGELCPGKTDPGPCAPGVLYNRETGKICPEDPEPPINPASTTPPADFQGV